MEYIKTNNEVKIGDVYYSHKLDDIVVVTDINLNSVTFQIVDNSEDGTECVMTYTFVNKLKLEYLYHIDLDEVPICDHCGLYCFYAYVFYDETYCGKKHMLENIFIEEYEKGFEDNSDMVYYTEFLFY